VAPSFAGASFAPVVVACPPLRMVRAAASFVVEEGNLAPSSVSLRVDDGVTSSE
jgi:hypothetical protein